MKKANYNEIDQALHSLAKRGESSLLANSFAGNHEVAHTEHLDADELNSYAEGLVPEMARAKFTEHLADCVACRNVVVSLTRALGPTPPPIKSEVERGHSFWDKLSALLSLPVLRFGVPALALTAIISIGFFAWRKDPQTDLVAQHQPRAVIEPARNTDDSAGKVTEQPQTNTSAGLTPVPTPKAPAPIVSATDTDGPLAQPKTEQSPSDSVSSVKPFSKDATAPPPPPAPAEVSSKAAGVDSFSERKIGALSSKPASAGEVQKSADKKQEQVNENVAQARARDENNFERQAEREDDNRAYTANAPAGPRRAEGMANTRGGYGRKNKRDTTDDDETRSVAGRSFRRQGSLWVDTAYASQATINVRRGSEQFRALVADEPAIRDVANSLSGEIILVWKGKTYRIR